jgi:hypothetical protein
MDPTTALILSQLGSAFLGGMFTPEGQELQSFGTGNGDMSAPNLLREAMRNSRDVFGMASDFAREPVSLPGSYVQDLPSFAGGGMPLPIGVTGRDPFAPRGRNAGSDGSSSLSLPGIARRRPAAGSLASDELFAPAGRRPGVRRRGIPTPQGPQGGGDDSADAMAALQMLGVR